MAMEGDKAAYDEVSPELQQNQSSPRKSPPPPGFPSLHVFFSFIFISYMHICGDNLIYVHYPKICCCGSVVMGKIWIPCGIYVFVSSFVVY